MAEETGIDTSVDGAAAAIEALLKQAPASEAPPESNEIQSQAPAPQAQASEANTAEEDKAPSDQAEDVQAAEVQTEQPKQAAPDMQAAMRAQAEATAARDHLLARANALGPLIQQLEIAVRGEFADIQSQEDLLRVGQTEPERYNRFVLAMNRINSAKAAQETAVSDLQRQQQGQIQAWRQGETEKLGQLLPELRDPQKGPVLADALHRFALANGYTAQQLAMASASDFKMLHNAMQFSNLEKAKATASAKAAKAPPVQQPGTTRQTGKDDKVQEDFARLQKSGSVQDAAALFRHIL